MCRLKNISHNINSHFSFLISVTEVNAKLTEACFKRHKKPRPKLKFRNMFANYRMNYGYLLQEQNAMEVRKNKCQGALSTHVLISLSGLKILC